MWSSIPNIAAPVLYAGYACTIILETYFFMAQRAALEIGRSASLDGQASRLMLPLWYVFNWPVQLAKWALLVLIFRAQGWLPALACFAIPFVISLAIPIPHRHFIPMFRNRLRRDLAAGENITVVTVLLTALTAVETQTRKE